MLSHYVRWFIILVILYNLVTFVVSTDPRYNANDEFFAVSEAVCVSIFVLEYAVRMWTIVEKRKYSHPVCGE